MLQYDPAVNLRHYPVPMSKYGTNPFGENLYRIVFTESRRHLVGGMWPDGSMAYHWVPKYRQISSAWILERWRFEPMTKFQWERDLVDPVSGWPLFGPYPARGDYDLCWEFDHGVDSDSMDNVVAFIEKRMVRSFQDTRDMISQGYEAEEKETRQNNFLDMRDTFPAFGSAPMTSGRFGRGTKTLPDAVTANELHMPRPRGAYKDVGGGFQTRTSFGAGA